MKLAVARKMREDMGVAPSRGRGLKPDRSQLRNLLHMSPLHGGVD